MSDVMKGRSSYMYADTALGDKELAAVSIRLERAVYGESGMNIRHRLLAMRASSWPFSSPQSLRSLSESYTASLTA